MRQRIENQSILRKIMLPAALAALVAMAVVLQAANVIDRLAQAGAGLVDRNATRVQLALTAESAFNGAAINEKNVILGAADASFAHAQITAYASGVSATLAALDHLAALTDTPAQHAKIETFRAAAMKRRAASEQVFALALSGHASEAFATSSGVAAKQRQIAAAAARDIIAAEIQDMHTARDASVAIARRSRLGLLAAAACGLSLAFGALGWIAVFLISRPLRILSAAMRRLAQGDLTIALPATDRHDEVGGLASALAVFLRNAVRAAAIDRDARAEAQAKEIRRTTIETAITVFNAAADEALAALDHASVTVHGTATAVSGSASQTNTQLSSTDSAACEAARSLQAVAEATADFHHSIAAISGQVSQSATVAVAAVAQVSETARTIDGLAQSAGEIGEVLGLIQAVASQTHLLALNATIEAARAGEAGRGFAVVAAEVKSLAAESATATSRIGERIAAIQAETSQAVRAVNMIGDTIARMRESTDAITAAVSQQNQATAAISANIQTISGSVAQVSTSIAGVQGAARETGRSADTALCAAGAVGERAGDLRRTVGIFLQTIRAA
jgi:methyl-accepting chemotaxis protein